MRIDGRIVVNYIGIDAAIKNAPDRIAHTMAITQPRITFPRYSASFFVE
jgi:hypothetical protein